MLMRCAPIVLTQSPDLHLYLRSNVVQPNRCMMSHMFLGSSFAPLHHVSVHLSFINRLQFFRGIVFVARNNLQCFHWSSLCISCFLPTDSLTKTGDSLRRVVPSRGRVQHSPASIGLFRNTTKGHGWAFGHENPTECRGANDEIHSVGKLLRPKFCNS